jgi:hypothetical protein
MEPEGSLPCSQKLINYELVSYGELLAPSLKTQRGGPLLVGCPLLLIQYICRYCPYLEAVSSIRNLRTLHAVV